MIAYLFDVVQAMGDELKQILENQRQLEEQFEQLTTAEQLKEQAYSMSATAQGIPCINIHAVYIGGKN